MIVVAFFFFFQAEDGIRDGRVTGVQTCALPISTGPPTRCGTGTSWARTPRAGRWSWSRSEERRVGKECRSRWSAYHLKKKMDPLIDTNAAASLGTIEATPESAARAL